MVPRSFPRVTLRKYLRAALPAIAVAYLVWLAWPGLAARFANDDAMNMHGYWQQGWRSLMEAQLHFWGPHYRPLGGLFYMPIYELAGLNPLPYRIVILAALAFNTYLTYITARLLTRSAIVSFLATILTCFHAAQFVLYFNTSQLYDVFCYTFWYLAFFLYARIRLQQKFLSWRAAALVLIAYIFALNSKEMGVTLPVMLVVFEVAFHNQTGMFQSGLRRQTLIKAAMPVVIIGVATLAFVIGKMKGPESLSNADAYRPRLSPGRFFDSNAHYAAELLYVDSTDGQQQTIGRSGIRLLWIVMLYLALRFRRPYLYWGFANATLGTLPIAFIPDRGGGCLYMPAFGYALFAAAAIHDATRWLSREPLFRWVHVRPLFSRLALIVAFLLWYGGKMHGFVQSALPRWHESQEKTFSALKQLQQIRSQIPPGAKIVYLDDPLIDWEMHFLTLLVLDDPAVEITLQKKHEHLLSEAELSSYNKILTFDNGVLKVIR